MPLWKAFHNGKTHLASALGYAACLKGYPVLFATAIDIVNTLAAAQAAGRMKQELKKYPRPALLLVDELGFLPIDKAGADLLFQIISLRYEQGALVITSNRAYKNWPEIFNNDRTLTSALLDRLLHHAETVVVEGKSYRMKDQIESCSDKIVSNIAENTIASWLDAVLDHHSYTYRHCMTVTGLAAAFGMQLGMSKFDVQRLAVAGLVHDIGKVRIPLDILDKPGKLTPEERLEINKHPGFGAEILMKDGQFGDDILDIVLHHHELLDGSGYPDGLRGDQISNPVRIMTIVDIYSALIDERSYKAPLPADEAYRILLGMEGKLEMCIVEAFEPVALNVQHPGKDSHTLQAAAV